jgi:hypothetical protein
MPTIDLPKSSTNFFVYTAQGIAAQDEYNREIDKRAPLMLAAVIDLRQEQPDALFTHLDVFDRLDYRIRDEEYANATWEYLKAHDLVTFLPDRRIVATDVGLLAAGRAV